MFKAKMSTAYFEAELYTQFTKKYLASSLQMHVSTVHGTL